MDLLMLLLSISALGAIVADEESCVGRCDLGFQRMNKCQCDALCSFYRSCCRDYHTVCVKNASLFPVDDIDEHDFLANDTDEMYPDTYTSLEPEPTHHWNHTHDPEPTHHWDPTHDPEPTHHWEPTQGPEPTHHWETTPEPEPTHHWEPTHDPEPTHHWEPTQGPEPTHHWEPTHEPEPTHHWEPTHGPEPTHEPEPTHHWEPTHGPESTHEPEPTHHCEPTHKPEPTHHWDPTHGPEPTHHWEPTHGPEPTHHWEPTHGPEPSPEPVPTHPLPGDVCLSEKPFNAFIDLKNGSTFAFQGQYFYELDKNGVVAGYPKLILDVWGVPGPIDAAFTRINCEGKTYLFKGMMYWRFDEGILEDGFPKPINAKFPGIPTDLDAALAIPASGIRGKERVYFFKGNRYWEYVFEHQPTQEECAGISISIPFQRYTYQMADKWDDSSEHIGSIPKAGATGPFFIRQHWHGIPSGVDAAMIGKFQMVPKQKERGRGRGRGRGLGSGKHHKKQRSKDQHRKDSSSEEDDANIVMPHHSVYFFVRDKYYRVNLASKRVDIDWPRYPRSITKYWFKCKVE